MCRIRGRTDLRRSEEEVIPQSTDSKEGHMRYPLLISTAALVAAAVMSVLSVPSALGQTAAIGQASKAAPAVKIWAQPKTPWGDPDLQGTWTSDDCIGTPFNRPVNLGDKL